MKKISSEKTKLKERLQPEAHPGVPQTSKT